MRRTDSELWDLILRNDQSAWCELVDRYKALVYGVGTYLGLSQADTADCFQQTWLSLYQHRRQLKDTSKISSWLVTTAKREALRLKRGAVSLPNDSLERIADDSPGPDSELELIERQVWLESALKDLDTPCQRLLDAFFFCEHEGTYEEIAKELGYSANTLGAKRLRCMQKLKAILQKNGYWRERI